MTHQLLPIAVFAVIVPLVTWHPAIGVALICTIFVTRYIREHVTDHKAAGSEIAGGEDLL